MIARRALMIGGLAGAALAAAPGRIAPVYAPALPGQPMAFPADHGAHPDFRTEWWYLTGWLETSEGPMGFQVTFFRTRPDVDQANPSAFAAKQVLFAHAALSDPKLGRLLHDQRIGRAGFGLAEAGTGDARLVLDDWTLSRGADNVWRTRAGGAEFTLDLSFRPTQAPILQGQGGYSRKGPDPAQASRYYTLPQLAVTGAVTREGRRMAVRGSAWLDREWSSTLLDPRAVGWDWAGINLDDGGALTVFQVRGTDGSALWAGGSLRRAGGAQTTFGPQDVAFRTIRSWRSPRTGAVWPVEQEVRLTLPEGERRLRLAPLMDDQELDSRAGGGPVYWEGAVRAPGGRGYLELTGYLEKLSL
jgi:predicted secreted hydrolase